MYIDDVCASDGQAYPDDPPGAERDERFPDGVSLIETEDGLFDFADPDHTVARSSFHDAGGEWVTVGERVPTDPMRVDTVRGDQTLTVPTEDTDGDGRPDTTIVSTPDGGAVLYSDIDGDGSADVITEIAATGEVTVARHSGDGQWTAVEQGRIASDGSYRAVEDDPTGDAVWARPPTDTDERADIRVDPMTGHVEDDSN